MWSQQAAKTEASALNGNFIKNRVSKISFWIRLFRVIHEAKLKRVNGGEGIGISLHFLKPTKRRWITDSFSPSKEPYISVLIDEKKCREYIWCNCLITHHLGVNFRVFRSKNRCPVSFKIIVTMDQPMQETSGGAPLRLTATHGKSGTNILSVLGQIERRNRVFMTLTRTAGVHQMRLLHRHSLYYCLCHLMTFYPQKRPYSSFETNLGRTDLRTYGRTDTTSYRDA